MPKVVVARINKIIFPFVWGKKREWMARSSVVHNKILSLHAVWLRRFFVDATHPWSSFFSHYVSSVFSQPVPQVLNREVIPAYLIKKLPPCYRGVLSAWVLLKGQSEQGAWVIPRPSGQTLPARASYSLLRQSSAVEHRSVAKYNKWGINVPWPAVWASLHLWRYVRSVQDTTWLTCHGILPVADRLVRFGMRVDPLCFCGQQETLLHLFTACPFSAAVIDWFHS